MNINWQNVHRDSNIHVTDFGPSWRDGIAFLAIIDAIKANLINLADMKRKTNRQRLEHAFDVAESELGIARLLDAEDVDVDKPDERSIMTYVAQFLHKYPEPKVSCNFNTFPSLFLYINSLQSLSRLRLSRLVYYLIIDTNAIS